MALTRALQVVITGDASGLKRATESASKDVDKLEGHVKKSSHGISTSFKHVGEAVGVFALADGLKESVQAAEHAQVAQEKLQTQLKASGISFKAHKEEIDKVIESTAKLSGLDDKDLQGAFTAIVRSTGSVSKGLKDTGIAADIARAKHMDVVKAGELVAKVQTGNTTILKRYGIAFTPVTKAQEALKESTKHATAAQVAAAKQADKTASGQGAIALLQKKFGGQAEAYGKTAAGAQDRMRVSVEHLKESIGKNLLPIVTKITGKVTDLVNWFQKGSATSKIVTKAVLGIAAALTAMFVVTKIVNGLKAFRAAMVAVNAVMVANPIGLVVLAIAGLVAAFIIAYKKSETFRNIVNGVFGAVKSAASKFAGFFTKTIPAAFQAVLSWAQAHWPIIVGILTGPFGFLVAEMIKHWDKVKRVFSAALDAIRGVLTSFASFFTRTIPNAASAMLGRLKNGWLRIKGLFQDGINAVKGVLLGAVSAFGDIGSSIGARLRRGLSKEFDAVKGIAVGLINDIIRIVDKLPFVNIHTIGGGSSARASGGDGMGVPQYARGGKVDRPTYIVGEEGPQHPEYVIPVNPAYRKRAVALWADAGHEIGMYAQGGIVGKAAGAVGHAVSSVGSTLLGGVKALIGKLPHNPFPDPFKGFGSYLLNAAKHYVSKKFASLASSVLSGDALGTASAVKGVGSFDGKPVDNWIIPILRFARQNGWRGSVTSGYRTPEQQLAAAQHYGLEHYGAAGPLGSNHIRSAYPGGAVDVTNAAELAGVLQTYQGRPSLVWGGPVIGDPVHFSATGHKRGGIMGFARGGVMGAAQAAYQAGFRGNALVNAVAIAGAESSFDPGRENLKYPDHSIGLWQINQLAHHGRYGTDAQLHDPLTNAKAAFAVSGGGRSFQAWSTWPGAAQGFVGRAQQAVASLKGSGGSRKSGTTSGSYDMFAGANAMGSIAPSGSPYGWSISRHGFGTPAIGSPGTVNPDYIPGSRQNYESGISSANLGIVEAGSNVNALLRADEKKRAVISARVTTIRAALKNKKLSRAVRIRLQDELALLLPDIPTLDDEIGQLHAGHIPGTDWADASGAAADTSGSADGGSTGADDGSQAVIDSNQAVVDSNNALADALKGVKDQLATLNTQTQSVNAVTAAQALRSVADLMSGQIFGRTQQRMATAGSGVGVRIP